MRRHPLILVAVTIVATLGAAQTFGCGATRSARSLAAEKLDKYYGFLSGGQSGSVFVVGVPSGRLIREIPVFEPRAAYGYAMHETDPRRQLLEATGGLWGDTHHPMLSEKNGVFDGRYLWINDLANEVGFIYSGHPNMQFGPFYSRGFVVSCYWPTTLSSGSSPPFSAWAS